MTTCPKCGAAASGTPAEYTRTAFYLGRREGRRQGHLEACSELQALMERTHEPGRYWAGRLRRRLARLRRSK